MGLLCMMLSGLFPALASGAEESPDVGIIIESQREGAAVDVWETQGLPGLSFMVLPAGSSSASIQELAEQGIHLMMYLPEHYLIGSQAPSGRQRAEAIETRTEQIGRFSRAVADARGEATLRGIIIALHPDLKQPRVAEYLSALSAGIKERFPEQQLYIITNQETDVTRPGGSLQDISLIRENSGDALMPAAMHVVPRFGDNVLRQLYEFFAAAQASSTTSMLAFHERDFLHYRANTPDFDTLIHEYTSPGPAVVPLPAPAAPAPRLHFSAVFLLLLWFSFGLHYFFSQSYRRSIKRYFLSHTFFVEDVLDRHVRFAVSALLVLIQTGLMWGLMFYTVVPATVSEAGFSGLSWHYPIIQQHWTLIVIFFISGTAFNLLCVLWLAATCFRANALVQAATLQMWPMHMGLLLVTAGVTAMASGASPVFGYALLSAFLLLNFAAFIIAAAQFSRQPSLSLPLHWLATAVLYVGIMTAAGIFFLYGSRLSEVMYLSAGI